MYELQTVNCYNYSYFVTGHLTKEAQNVVDLSSEIPKPFCNVRDIVQRVSYDGSS